MQHDVNLMERGSLRTLERRLDGVEETLRALIDNEHEMEDRLTDTLGIVKEEMEKNTLEVMRMKHLTRKMNRSQTSSKFLFGSILAMLILWTIFTNWLRI